MTERATPRPPWRRVLTTTRGRAEVVALSLTIVVCGALALEVVPAIADDEKLAGTPVPAEDVPSLVAAALSCPALTPPKVAAQVMAATGFGADGANSGVAGMDDATWSKWRPSSTAARTDRQASMLAMAHRTCEIVGQLRAAKIDGDLWAAALATDKVGLSAVIKAKGVPASAEPYVDKVTAYSNWYADQPVFSAKATAAAASAEPSMEVPKELVADVNAAGRICATVTPARIAAQLRALSGFNASLRSSNGGAGIAQFSDSLWEKYQPGASASRWNPDDAILAMGTAMCDMSNQFAGLSGADPYTLALGAYQWGPNIVRQANGLPRANVPQLADQVGRYVPDYEKDARLTSSKPAPKPSASPSASKPSASASASASAPASAPAIKPSTAAPSSTAPTTTPATKPAQPEPVKLFDPEARYQIRNAWAGAVVELPGGQIKLADGTRVQLYNNLLESDQYWRFQEATTDGYVMIINDFSKQALSIENASLDNYAKLVVTTKNESAKEQQWKLIDGGDGKVQIQNRNSGKLMELLGDDLGPPKSDGTWNEYWVEQWDRVEKINKDQFWMLVK
ncbi:RICIN domain-containing protein [Actinoplanes sp. NPDC051494]|uniref:RICIN domain-containing protein n=1 Tax=Actinoplanes sp. NPDC051494 TaxID=3363907 RepID=UPI0037917D02